MSEPELRRQLSALVRAGLVKWEDGIVEAVPVGAESDRQATLFGAIQ